MTHDRSAIAFAELRGTSSLNDHGWAVDLAYTVYAESVYRRPFTAPWTWYIDAEYVSPTSQNNATLSYFGRSGIPITVVCTKADLMDSVADELGMKSGWEERTDWIQQVLRTICLSCTSRSHLVGGKLDTTQMALLYFTPLHHSLPPLHCFAITFFIGFSPPRHHSTPLQTHRRHHYPLSFRSSIAQMCWTETRWWCLLVGTHGARSMCFAMASIQGE